MKVSLSPACTGVSCCGIRKFKKGAGQRNGPASTDQEKIAVYAGAGLYTFDDMAGRYCFLLWLVGFFIIAA